MNRNIVWTTVGVLLLLLADCGSEAAAASSACLNTAGFNHSLVGITRMMQLLRAQEYAGIQSAYSFFFSTLALHGWFLFWPLVLLLSAVLYRTSERFFRSRGLVPQPPFYFFCVVFVSLVTCGVLPFICGVVTSGSVWWVIIAGVVLGSVIVFLDPENEDPQLYQIAIGAISLLVLICQPFVFALFVACVFWTGLAALGCLVLFPVVCGLARWCTPWLRARAQSRHFFCPNCYHRHIVLDNHLSLPVRWSGRHIFREKTIKHESFEDYFYCGRCGATKLMKNAETVVGVIGSCARKLLQQGNRVYLALWNEKEKQVINAEIDLLEIRYADISYDFAINDLINLWTNDLGKKVRRLKRISVHLMNKAPVPEESLRLLQQYFQRIIRY